jgi:hypothetical protein
MQRRTIIFIIISALIVALVCGSFTPFTPFIVYAEPPTSGWEQSKDCTGNPSEGKGQTCCWRERIPGQILGKTYCQTCKTKDYPSGPMECTKKEPQALEQPPTPQPFDPTAPLQGGVLEQQEQTPPTSAPGTTPGVLQQLEEGDFAPGIAPGFLRQQEQQPPAGEGAAELPPPPATEETQPATEEQEEPAVPVCQEGLEFNENLGFCVPTECPEGQVLDEEAGVCVLEEPEVIEQEGPERQQSEPEEQDQQQQPLSEEESSEENSN